MKMLEFRLLNFGKIEYKMIMTSIIDPNFAMYSWA